MSLRLEPYKGPKSRYKCPKCQKIGEFTRYIDEDGNYLADDIGRCNRENRCGYHKLPNNIFHKNSNREFNCYKSVNRSSIQLEKLTPDQFDVLPTEKMFESLTDYEKNNFYKFLVSLFDESTAITLARKYIFGTSILWEGATAFWQIDKLGRIRQLKTILYNPTNGRRVKSGEYARKWDYDKKEYFLDTVEQDKSLVNGRFIDGGKFKNLSLRQCFFGEHLLSEDGKVAIVESEKTAIITSYFYPKFIWLATGGSNGAGFTKPEVIQVLRNREVVFFPDLGQYDKWNQKINQIRDFIPCKLYVSEFLEQNASQSEKMQGLDIADFLIKNFDNSKESKNQMFSMNNDFHKDQGNKDKIWHPLENFVEF